jgi:phosphatidylglycerophosphate synthase
VTNEEKSGATGSSAKPNDAILWDQRLARLIVRPLVNSSVTPNQITTVRLLMGLVACALIAWGGDRSWLNWGATLFILSNFLDHADGELARLTGKSSPFGHHFDIASDALIHALIFIALGFALAGGRLGDWAIVLGIIATCGVGTLFWIFSHRMKLYSKAELQPRWAGFELEDVMYLLAPVVWLGWELPLLVIAGVASPIAVLVLLWLHRRTLFAASRREGLS